MAEQGRAGITGGEWDILNALWGGGPSTARGVAERLSEERGWAYSTVKTMLDRMVDKGLARSRQVGNVWEYSAGVAEAEARKGAWRRFVDAAFGGAVAPALEFIASESRLSKKERERLLDLLRKEGADER